MRPARDQLAMRALLCSALIALWAGCTSDSGGSCPDGTCGVADAATDDGCGPGGCPPVATCSSMAASGECPAHRVCETTATGPVCRQACDAGYQLDAATGACTPCAIASCARPTCSPDVDGSIEPTCADAFRACVADGGDARCGDCLDGYRADAVSGDCVIDTLCGGRDCTADEVAVRDGSSCQCAPRACTDAEAERPDGTCRACSLSCSGVGETGQPYPRTDATGACVCATEPGYYWPLGDAGRARPCDEDGDGWLSRDAYAAWTATDATIRAIARTGCRLREVDAVVLANEYGQELPVWSCAEGLRTSCTGPIVGLPLVEPDRNDSDARLAESGAAVPVYSNGIGGRRLAAAELNAATKACVTQLGDFDGDGTQDVAQAQNTRVTDLLSRWTAVASFVELHRMSYRAPLVMNALGRLVISERSRCDAGFPLSYPHSDAAYWLQCARGRDARFDRELPGAGLDFAAWSCDAATGSCPVPPPPVVTDPTAADAPAHGLCDLAGAWDAAWRGMHHHSQFRCVMVGDEDQPYVRSSADFQGSAAYLEFLRCHAAATGEVSCQGFPASAGSVGLAALTYAPDRETQLPDGTLVSMVEVAGCIDESQWVGLCPGDSATTPVFKRGDDANFGHLRCGCETPATYYPDLDRDGYGSTAGSVVLCEAPAGFIDRGGDCNDTDRDVHPDPASPDLNDLAGVDSDCDGVDGVAAQLVFVSLAGNDSAGNGTREAPVRTLQRAIDIASGRIPRANVMVGSGTHDGTVALRDGVSLFGGYDPADSWRRHSDRRSIVRVSSPVGLHQVGVQADGISQRTVLQRLDVVVTDGAGAGVNTYGIRAVNSPGLYLDHLDVTVGRGGNGAVGATGHDGAGGGNGDRGGPGEASRAGGGGGRNDSCPGSNGHAGGNGGQERFGCGDGSTNASAGGGGHCGGARGADGRCGHHNGDDGQAGGFCAANRGGDGIRGQGATSTGGLVDGYWLAHRGSDGTSGAAGIGGGGGGGGGGPRASCSRGGGGGGGGGAGGCGGGRGIGGGGGGGSFGLFLVSSRIGADAITVRAGNGGAGGAGGGGGAAGPGGAGGEAGARDACGGAGTWGGAGARGGGGHSGGSGGGGGGGAGGVSYGMYVCGAFPVGMRGEFVPAAAGPGGSGGSGASAGAPGAAAEVGTCL